MDFTFWNGYVDWAGVLLDANQERSIVGSTERPDILRNQDGSSSSEEDLYEPIFVHAERLTPLELKDLVDSDDDLIFPKGAAAIVRDQNNKESEAFIYVRYGTPRERPYYTVLHVGLPVRVSEGLAEPRDLKAEPGFTRGALFGVIDDGIGFLNARFREVSDPEQTRLLGIWLQSLAQIENNGKLQLGKIFDQGQINGMIQDAALIGEQAVYRQVNRDVYPPGLTHVVEQTASHGTHILDLAIGMGPEDRGSQLADVPILAVQLPPDSIDDTSGTRLETHLLMGLRWLIKNAQDNGFPILVVNASLGITAGPKNGRKFLESQIAEEIRRAALNKNPVEVHVIFPFGNDYENRQVAILAPEKNKAKSVDLVLQRDDLTPSYVEIRPTSNDDLRQLETLSISISLPDGTQQDLGTLTADTDVSVENAHGDEIGRLYHVGQRPQPGFARYEDPYLILAFGPTAPFVTDQISAHEPIAGPGPYKITLSLEAPQEIEFSLQVQRDDSAVGFSQRGRQAFLDDEGAYVYDPATRDFNRLGKGSNPITHAGTNSAYTTIPSDNIHNVGAATVKDGPVPDQKDIEPAGYASKGAAWTTPGPDCSAISEDTHTQRGVTASGSFSCSSAGFSGSSTAAATFARHLLLQKVNQVDPRAPVQPSPPEPDRLGAFTIVDNPAIQRRPRSHT